MVGTDRLILRIYQAITVYPKSRFLITEGSAASVLYPEEEECGVASG